MPVPAYRRVCEILRSRILSGQYPGGFKLPCERDLAKQFGVSQITIRHALRILQDRWMVDRRRRVGTIVRSTWPHKRLMIDMHDPGGSIRLHVSRLTREVVESKRIAPVAHVAELLELPEGKKCLFARWRDSLDGVPIALSRIFIPVDLATSVDDDMLRRVDFIDLWLKAEGLAVSHHAAHADAITASDVCMRYLRLKAGYPVLRSVDVLYSGQGRPLGEFVMECRGDCFRLSWTQGQPLRKLPGTP